ncbi:MAG TPA: glycine--tRNA ligase subunit beta [Candidatus Sulfotelmatobacter sp.]|nr:glycine--tRNA ligase subunit beta [Candidatus Sulfotelmatobacter sp.]
MPDLLLEIGCEEIPARMIDAASQELRERVGALLQRERLATSQPLTSFDTPRRLAVLATGIPLSQRDVIEQLTGPSVNVAYKDGQPTPAAHAFAKKAGVDVSALERVTTPKGEYLASKVTKKGRSTATILAEGLPKEIAAIYWPKNMYWRKPNERFVRPVRWLVAMLDGEAIPLEFDGVRAGNTSRGHRILTGGAVTIPHAGPAYIDALRAAKVLGRAEREQQIRQALDAATRTIPGARWREDKALLETVVNLTEFPSAILGSFDSQFLALPEEVLVTVMRDHQKYFAVEDTQGKLLPHFLAVLNTDSDPQGLIRHGNERVLRARFNDARFFWETDQKKSLLERFDSLRHVTFQKDLGSYFDKTLRVQRLCSWLSEQLKSSGIAVRPGVIHKAACLSKTDLTTELVKEFTELQGIVGGLYARVQELDSDLPTATRLAIADAIYDHYKPESTEDEVPRSTEGAVLSIGDKADTIAGMFALGLVPSGSKDPFALRRQANAIVKVIAEKKFPLRLNELMRDGRAGYDKSEAEKKFVEEAKFSTSVKNFFRERMEFYLRDVRGYAYDVVKAVLAAEADDVVDASDRCEAVTTIRRDRKEDFESVCVSFKRIKNILSQAGEKGLTIPDSVNEALNGPVGSPQDDLWRLGAVNTYAEYEVRRKDRHYVSALLGIASLRPKLERFFNEVMVMVDDPVVRANRLAILNKLYRSFSTIADFSEIVTEGTANPKS